MKKISSLFILLCIICNSVTFSQNSFTSYDSEMFLNFFNTTTYVQLSGDVSIDEKIKKTLNEKWNFTKIKYVNTDSLPQKLNATESMLLIETIEITRTSTNPKIPTKINYFTNLCIRMSGDIDSVNMTNVISSVPLFCDGNEERKAKECSFQEVDYKIEILLNQLIEVITFTKEDKISSSYTWYSRYINQFNKKCLKTCSFNQSKKLLICEDIFNDNFTKKDFECKFPFEIVDRETYKQKIQFNKPDYIVLLSGIDFYNSFVLSLYDLELNKTLYIDCNINTKRLEFNKNQVKSLSDQLEKLVK